MVYMFEIVITHNDALQGSVGVFLNGNLIFDGEYDENIEKVRNLKSALDDCGLRVTIRTEQVG